MATTISALRAPARITLGAANVLTRVDLPERARRFTVQSIGVDCKIAWSGTDGQAIGAAYMTLPSDNLVEIVVEDGKETVDGGRSIYLASEAGGNVVEVLAEE
jgi:hypothetical protein